MNITDILSLSGNTTFYL